MSVIVGGLDGDVGAGADRDADIGLRERGRVVDAVADHRDDVTPRLQVAPRRPPCRPAAPRPGPGRCRPARRSPRRCARGRRSAWHTSIPSARRRATAVGRLGLDGVGDRDDAERRPPSMATNSGVSPAPPPLGGSVSDGRQSMPRARNQRSAADEDSWPVDARCDAVAGDRLERRRRGEVQAAARRLATIASAEGCSEPRSTAAPDGAAARPRSSRRRGRDRRRPRAGPR